MKKTNTRALAECSVMVALSLVLTYIKIPLGSSGGSVDLVMIPLIIAAYRWGLGWGLGSGFIFGTLKFILGGKAFYWTSIIFDYSVAYMFVGFAGLMERRPRRLWLGALIGCFARFVIHFISGVTVYRISGMAEVLGIKTANVWLYSLLYNASYMLPNTILACVVCFFLERSLEKQLLK